MLQLYRDLAVLAVKRGAKSWLAALSIPIYVVIFLVAANLLAPLGILGRFLLGFLGVACAAGYLSLLADAVAGNKIRLADIKNGMRNLWDVMSVAFALWVISLGVMVLTSAAGRNALFIAVAVELLCAVFFNAVPELLYKSRNRSFALLKESVDFVKQNPVAWFAPNILFAIVLLWATGLLSVSHPGAFLNGLIGLASPTG